MASAVASAYVDVTSPTLHEAPLDPQPATLRRDSATGDKMDESSSNSAISTTIDSRNSDNTATGTTTKITSGSISDCKENDDDDGDDDGPQTPTRHSFCGVPGQRPLPTQPLTSPVGGLAAVVRNHLKDIDDDIDMAEADTETVADEDLSDNESATSESQRLAKKKKGQRFFCTDFPPCQLSFTRSEHLARHIRKHTGERPFQCHCSRRFSRLDNLRQHAQTVHVNEEIPGDSLAATSTRFQRQVRTDRVRPTTGRPRTSTAASTQSGAPNSRGHNRNLSTSSIASTTSNFSISDDIRKRQPPLAMATDSNKRPAGALDEYMHSSYDASPQAPHYHQPSSGMSTPTSQLYAYGNSGYASGYASPSRSSYYSGQRHIRRLSVPSSSNPYQSNPYASSGQLTPTSMHGSVYSNAPSGYASPTSSVFSQGRLESESDIEYRRRTWHPNTQSNYSQRPATSGLSYHQTPDEERPALSSQPAALTRLPGIESFDQIPPLPIRQPTSPSMSDAARPYAIDRSLDHALHQGLHRLDITANGPPAHESYWPRPELAAVDRVPPLPHRGPPALQHAPTHKYMHHMSMPEPPTTPKRVKRQAWYGGPMDPSQSLLRPTLPLHTRTSPEDSGSSDGIATPAISQSQEYHPVIVNHGEPQAHMQMVIDEKPNGYGAADKNAVPPDNQHKPALPIRADSGFHSYQPSSMQGAPPMPTAAEPYSFRLQAGHDPATANKSPHHPATQHGNDMGRLEALVAVATSEGRASETRP